MPDGNYRWKKNIKSLEKKIKNGCWKNWTGKESKGLILSVNLNYPSKLHLEQNDYPLAPTKSIVKITDLSPESLRRLKQLKTGNSYKEKKLISSFHSRQNYILHYMVKD